MDETNYYKYNCTNMLYYYIYSFQPIHVNEELKKLPHDDFSNTMAKILHHEIAFLCQAKATENTKKSESKQYCELHVQPWKSVVTSKSLASTKNYRQKLLLHVHTVPGICLPCHEVPAVSGAVCPQVQSSLPKASTPVGWLVNKNSPYQNPNCSNPQVFNLPIT